MFSLLFAFAPNPVKILHLMSKRPIRHSKLRGLSFCSFVCVCQYCRYFYPCWTTIGYCFTYWLKTNSVTTVKDRNGYAICVYLFSVNHTVNSRCHIKENTDKIIRFMCQIEKKFLECVVEIIHLRFYLFVVCKIIFVRSNVLYRLKIEMSLRFLAYIFNIVFNIYLDG